MGINVRRRRGDYWEIKINHQGQRRSIACGRGKTGKQAAERAVVQIRADLASGGALKMPAEPVPTIEEAAAQWLVHYTTRRKPRPGTLALKKGYLEKHVVPFFAGRRIDAVDEDAIDALIRAKQAVGGALRGKTLNDRTIKGGILGPLRGVLDLAVRRGWIRLNPLRGGEPFVTEETSQPEPDPFDHGELVAILAAAAELNARWALLLRCWAQGGPRSGELRGLRRRDLDPQTGDVWIERTRSAGRTGPTKTKKSRRLVRLTHPVCETVAEWEAGATPQSLSVLDELAKLARVVPLDLDAPLFPSLVDLSRPMDERELRTWWERTVRRAHVRYRPAETLRHTFISTLLSRRAPEAYVANQAGHSVPVMWKSYAKWIAPARAADATSRNPHATRPAAGRANPSIPQQEMRDGL